MSQRIGDDSTSRQGYQVVQIGPEELEIPVDWEVATVDDVASRFISGGTPDSDNEDYWGGEIPWTTCAVVEGPQFSGQKEFITQKGLENSSASLAPEGSLLFGTRVNVANVGRTTKEIAISQDLTGVVLDEERVSPDFVTWYLLYNQSKIRDRYSQGSTIQGMITSDLKSLPLLLPPLSEQRRIAAILSTVDEQIQQTDGIIGKLREIRKGLIQDLIFTGIDRSSTREIHIGPKPVEIAEGWESKTIGDVTTTVQYGCSESLSQEGEYPMFRMNNIEDGRMVSEPMKYVDLDDETAEKYRVEQDDILFNRTNSIDLVGKAGIFDLEGEFVFASYLIRVQTTEEMNPWFLNYFINSKIGQDVMFSIATRGASQANINATNLKGVRVPVPPRKEQDQIVERIRAAEEKIEVEEVRKERLQELKRGIMQDLLTGKVRTHQLIENERS